MVYREILHIFLSVRRWISVSRVGNWNWTTKDYLWSEMTIDVEQQKLKMTNFMSEKHEHNFTCFCFAFIIIIIINWSIISVAWDGPEIYQKRFYLGWRKVVMDQSNLFQSDLLTV